MSREQVNAEYKNPEHITEQDVKTMLESAAAGVLDDGQYISIRVQTPVILHEAIKEASWALGLSEKEVEKYAQSRCMIMQVHKARQAQAPVTEQFKTSHGHGLSAEQIIGVIKRMANPDYIGYQDSNDRFFEVVHYGKKDSRINVAVFFDINEYKSPANVLNYKSSQKFYDVIVTLFPMTKEEIKALVKNDDNIVFTPNYKKGVPQVTSGKYLPSVLNDTPFYEDIITDSNENSNPSTQKNSDRFTEIDRDYLSAVERGDMETAQRMVYEAAMQWSAYYVDGKISLKDLSQIIILYPENIKSADPVTYDDNGNVIPLSERFNDTNPDIRYQDRDYSVEPEDYGDLFDDLFTEDGDLSFGEEADICRAESIIEKMIDYDAESAAYFLNYSVGEIAQNTLGGLKDIEQS